MEKRRAKRLVLRLFVKYGVDRMPYVGFTEDLSPTGIYLKSNVVFPPKTQLTLKLALPDSQIAHLTGKVMWEKKIPPTEAGSEKTGMGIRILKADEVYLEFIKRNCP